MPKQIASLATPASTSQSPIWESLRPGWRERVRAYIKALLPVVALSGLGACCSDSNASRQFRVGAYDASFKTFERRADNGDSAAINFVGIHYYLGLGVSRDLSAAARWFARGARTGNADAQRNLGVLYLRGWGVKRDKEMAYGWLIEASNRGNHGAGKYLKGLEITPNQTARARLRVAKQLRQSGEIELPRDGESP